MKKHIVLAVFFLWQAAFGLQAPYLYSADSVADTAVQLTWRNNSIDYQGIIILRKTAAAGAYSVIDTAAGTATSFVDITKPLSPVTYYYALTAYSLTEHADTSNGDSVTMTPKKPMGIFINPQNLAVSYDTLTKIANIQFYDSSTVETGYKIYKSTNFAAFGMIKDIVSSTPSQKGIISYTDSAISPNTWYRYYALAYNSQQGLSSNIDTLFTFDVVAMFQNISRKCSILNKLSSFPIKYKWWSLKSGDTIVLTENGVPDSTIFSIINVSNPSAPVFAGTGKSPVAILNTTLIKGSYIFGNNILDSIICYRYSFGEFNAVSGIACFRNPAVNCSFSFPGFLSSTTFLAMKYEYFQGWDYRAILFSFNNNILSCIDTSFLISGGSNSAFKWFNYMTYNGRFFLNYASGYVVASDTFLEIIDYTYSPKVETTIHHTVPIKFPYIIDDIIVDVPSLKYARTIFIDTVKNLVFALFQDSLNVYSCKITTGTTQNFSSRPQSIQSLRIAQETGNSSCIIFLPRHSHPADVSIYTLSGRLAYRFNNVSGESINWHRGNKTGVYLIKAVIDGEAYSAKSILTK